MSTPKELDKKIVLDTALALIRPARKSVLATMSLAEELTSPLPEEYFSLLKKKLIEGIQLTRIGFGTKEDFERIKKEINLRHPNYHFILAKSENYKRMLLVDEKYLMFAIDEAEGRRFFYTEDNGKIIEYMGIFKRPLDLSFSFR